MSRSTSRSRSRSRMRVPRRLRALAVMLPALALGACVAGPNFVAPSEHSAIGTSVYTAAPLPHLPTPAQAADTASEVADAALASTPWWLPLASPRLDATIREALQHNRDLQSARATLAQMRELTAAAEGDRYPKLNLDASAGRQKYGAAFLGPDRLPPFSFYSVGFSVSYLFDFAGGVRRSIEQQSAMADYQQHEVDAAALSLSGNGAAGSRRRFRASADPQRASAADR